MYCFDGILSGQFDLAPSSAEVRVLNGPYRLGGVECDGDYFGLRQTRKIHGPVGRVSIIAAGAQTYYCKHSHIPSLGDASLRGAHCYWPLCVSTGTQKPANRNWLSRAGISASSMTKPRPILANASYPGLIYPGWCDAYYR